MSDDNAASEEGVKKKKARAKAVLELEQSDLTWFLKDPRGRRVLWRILESCGISRSSFSFNQNQTYFWEGERNVGLMLQAKVLDACKESEDYYGLMITENRGEENG